MPSYSDPTVIPIAQDNKVQLGSILVMIAGLISVGFAGFLYFQTLQVQAQVSTTESDLASKQSQISSLQSKVKDIDSYSSFSASLHTLFDGQKHWETVLANIEPLLYKRMIISSMILNNQNSFTLTGTTLDYSDYYKINASLNSDTAKVYFAQVKPLSVSKSTAKDTSASSINFSFQITFNPSIYLPAKAN